MRNNLLPFILFTLLLFANCRKGDATTSAATQPPNPANALTGKWKHTFFAEDMNGNFLLDGSEKEPPDEEILFTFNAGGTGLLTDGADKTNFQWSLNDKKLSILAQEEDSTWDPENTVEFFITTLGPVDMVWQDMPDSATSFIGFVRQ